MIDEITPTIINGVYHSASKDLIQKVKSFYGFCYKDNDVEVLEQIIWQHQNQDLAYLKKTITDIPIQTVLEQLKVGHIVHLVCYLNNRYFVSAAFTIEATDEQSSQQISQIIKQYFEQAFIHANPFSGQSLKYIPHTRKPKPSKKTTQRIVLILLLLFMLCGAVFAAYKIAPSKPYKATQENTGAIYAPNDAIQNTAPKHNEVALMQTPHQTTLHHHAMTDTEAITTSARQQILQEMGFKINDSKQDLSCLMD